MADSKTIYIDGKPVQGDEWDELNAKAGETFALGDCICGHPKRRRCHCDKEAVADGLYRLQMVEKEALKDPIISKQVADPSSRIGLYLDANSVGMKVALERRIDYLERRVADVLFDPVEISSVMPKTKGTAADPFEFGYTPGSSETLWKTAYAVMLQRARETVEAGTGVDFLSVREAIGRSGKSLRTLAGELALRVYGEEYVKGNDEFGFPREQSLVGAQQTALVKWSLGVGGPDVDRRKWFLELVGVAEEAEVVVLFMPERRRGRQPPILVWYDEGRREIVWEFDSNPDRVVLRRDGLAVDADGKVWW